MSASQSLLSTSIGIIEYNTPGLTSLAIVSAAACADAPNEIILIVNSDDSLSKIPAGIIKEHVDTLIINETNLGFTAGANQIIQEAGENDVVLLNSDTLCATGWLKELRRAAYAPSKNKKVGLACPQLKYKNGRLKHRNCALEHFAKNRCLDHLEEMELGGLMYFREWFPFCCAYIKRDLINEMGLLNEGNFHLLSDVEYCKRAAARGWVFVHTHRSEIHHLVGASGNRTEAKWSKGDLENADIKET